MLILLFVECKLAILAFGVELSSETKVHSGVVAQVDWLDLSTLWVSRVSGLGPLLMGHLHDQFGSYDIALLANVSLLLGSAAVAFGLSGRSEMKGQFDTGHIVSNRAHFGERKSM
jgi:hypothetical protein